jgi:hypothetical protein
MSVINASSRHETHVQMPQHTRHNNTTHAHMVHTAAAAQAPPGNHTTKKPGSKQHSQGTSEGQEGAPLLGTEPLPLCAPVDTRGKAHEASSETCVRPCLKAAATVYPLQPHTSQPYRSIRQHP